MTEVECIRVECKHNRKGFCTLDKIRLEWSWFSAECENYESI